MSIKKILFIFHEDTKSGAPKVMYDFIVYLNRFHSKEFLIDIYIKNKTGEFYEELKNNSNKIFTFPKTNNIKRKISNFLFKKKNTIDNIIIHNNYDIIYGNTIVTLQTLYDIKIKFPKIKTIIHVHESEYLCDLILDVEKAKIYFQKIDKIISVSNFTKNNLILNYNINVNKVDVVYPYVDLSILSADINYELKKTYKEGTELLITNIGNPHLTKGTDLIPQIAIHLRKLNPYLKFKILIIGKKNENDYIKAIKLDIKKLNLSNYIEIIDHVPDPNDYLKISDLYIIPSREDSFSLMGIYANHFNIPVISFENNGGLHEIFENKNFNQVEYLNTKKFSEVILNLIQNKENTSKSNTNFHLNDILKENLVKNYRIVTQCSQ